MGFVLFSCCEMLTRTNTHTNSKKKKATWVFSPKKLHFSTTIRLPYYYYFLNYTPTQRGHTPRAIASHLDTKNINVPYKYKTLIGDITRVTITPVKEDEDPLLPLPPARSFGSRRELRSERNFRNSRLYYKTRRLIRRRHFSWTLSSR